jgi:hypothetical protein
MICSALSQGLYTLQHCSSGVTNYRASYSWPEAKRNYCDVQFCLRRPETCKGLEVQREEYRINNKVVCDSILHI